MISQLAVVETDQIGERSVVHPFAVIRKGVVLGRAVVIHPHVVIEAGVEIGDDVEVFPGSYIGKMPKGVGATARPPTFEKIVTIGPRCAIGPHAVIYYDVRIGSNTLIGDGASIREKVTIGEYCIVSRGVTVNYNSRIGSRTKIMDLSHITGNCQIGDDVFISVMVATTNDAAIGKLAYDEARVQGPRIGNGAAIGAMANLLPGIDIGAGAVIGAGSVVSKDIPAGKFAIGSPARVLKNVGSD
jgi:UDP-3-O-[3-hydroxymyristoyl] glucosamine N-acyltransferase